MDIDNLWVKAQEKTEVIRGRVRSLPTFAHTRVPYILLAESVVNEGHTVIRRGKVIVEKPLIVLPEDMPQFEGFNIEKDLDMESESLQMFLMMRGIRFPSLKYNHMTTSLDLNDGSLSKNIAAFKEELEKEENVSTALIVGPEDCWQISVLLYIASLVGRCMKTDVMNIMDRFRKSIDR